ncbi:MAG: molecular chaperone HtpG, partial [Clostridia bacterium]|nr:molecular chaperone HtpG [Clostridia bacterium]
NISREMLQHDRQLQLIASRLEKKIKSELFAMQQNDREKYDKFYEQFGTQLKYGAYAEFGKNKELLQDLLMFDTSEGEKKTTLAEYVGRMKEGQEVIYYASGGDRARLDALPQAEQVRDKGYEMLYLTADVDEFCIQVLREYQGKRFQNVSDGELDLTTDEEKEQAKEQQETHKDLLDLMKEALDGKVSAVKISSHLKTHPVCLTTEGGFSIEMERVLRSMPGAEADAYRASRVLEINANHPIFEKLAALAEDDRDKLAEYTKLLYDQALLIEGLPVEDPVAFSEAMCKLMSE